MTMPVVTAMMARMEPKKPSMKMPPVCICGFPHYTTFFTQKQLRDHTFSA